MRHLESASAISVLVYNPKTVPRSCCLFFVLYHQTYKKGTAGKKDPRHNGIKSVNGHSNGATHTDAVKHRKPRTD